MTLKTPGQQSRGFLCVRLFSRLISVTGVFLLAVTMYKIKNWDSIYENSESKKYKKLSWVAVPNKHEGKGWGRMVAQKNNIHLFCGWNLIVQIASKCNPRGSLVDDGKALTAEDMAFMTGFPESLFKVCLNWFSDPKIAWLEDLRKSSEISENTPVEQNRTEQKRTEQNNKRAFVRPTIQQVQEYCKERENKIDPEKWMDHYQSNGWKVGKNPMKDWMASVRTWEKGELNATNQQRSQSTIAQNNQPEPGKYAGLTRKGW